ncbi:cyanophycin synthetase [Alkaliphilus transvaalensis]|uniref:cyanophycin synthetase n=1 Tax=Alkaliphilus transvaalensis TaxID=114628 RepID=UPI00047B72B1|nr:cyanophycin synthetase [Alkaliphilus transvaalensis]
MNLKNIRVYSGRNIYSHWPVIRVDVDLGEYVDVPSCDLEGFNDKLLNLLPGLWKHKCSPGYEGGFCERLERGTYLAHILEHVALEIQIILGYDLRFGKARYLEDETVYCVVFSYENEVAGYEAAKLAFELLMSIIHKVDIDIENRISLIRNRIKEKQLGPSTAAIVEEARKKKIPVMRLDDNSLIQLGYGKYSRKIQATLTDQTSCIAVDTSCDKELTKLMLTKFDIPVPEGRVVDCPSDAIQVAEDLGYPVVVKPHNGNQGKGVSLDLRKPNDVKKAFYIAKEYSERIIVEKYIKGKHYRIAVVGDKVIAVAQRLAAHIVGNGNNTIRELIELENLNPCRGDGHEKPLTKIKIDNVTQLILEKQDLTLSYIPSEGEIIYLKENANLSTGGIAIDATDEIHPDNALLAINAVRIIGLDVAGVDITIEDISNPIGNTNLGAVIEVNACPGIRMHHYPSKGKSRNVAEAIINLVYPENAKHSIPIVSVTGTNGKTTTSRMLSKILQKNNLVVGLTSTGGVYIQDELILKGDTTGPKSAQTVLMDKRVEAAVLETARGGIVNRGLGYEIADVGIITNIGDDHLGLDGINTLEDMADCKSLVVEAVKDEGYAVLNADDSFTPQIMERIKSKLILFSVEANNELLQNHIKNGGTAVYLFDGQIYLYNGNEGIQLLDVKEIPATYNGALKHNIENSLAAIAGAYGIGVELSVICAALREFNNDYETNPGRFNVFDLDRFKVIVDYGHNIDGFTRVLEGLKEIEIGRLVGVIGVPGDRTDISILKIGEISGKYFDYVYIKEDKDLRGRMPEEVAKILKKGCQLAGLSEDKVIIEVCEIESLKLAMENAQDGDTIVVFYEDYEPLIDLIEDYKEKMVQEPKTLDIEIAKAAGGGKV